jgi:predicted phosphodiesterase
MRIGILSDVHANWPALRAVLKTLERRGVDRVLVAGDIVGYGGQPNECVTALRRVGAQCVAGNHDLYLLGRLPDTRFSQLARASLEVHRALLTPDVHDFLSSLPLRLQVGDVVVTHGSLDSPEEYVRDEGRALELLGRLSTDVRGARTLVLGHTHKQWCVTANREAARTSSGTGTVQLDDAPRLINPGSVGQSRQRERRPRARFAVLETRLDSGTDTGKVEFCAVDYDVRASVDALRSVGLPDRCLHAPPRIRSRVRRLLRRVVPAA